MLLLERTTHEKLRVRTQALLDLERLLTARDVPWLVRMLNRQTNRYARLAAVTLLDHFRDRYAIGILTKTLRLVRGTTLRPPRR